jgi:hypothetical protein
MTIQEAPAAMAKLAFGTTFRAAFAMVFGRFWSFVRAALLPVALSMLLALAGIGLLAVGPSGPSRTVLDLLLQLLGLVPLVILGIACHRLVLLGRQAGAIPRPLLGRRTLVYLGYMVLFGIIIALPLMAFGTMMLGERIVVLGDDPDDVASQTPLLMHNAVLLLFVFYLVYLYFMTRLSLVFPAVAIDQKLGPRGSWRLTRGASGFKLYALLIVITLLCLAVTLVGMFVLNTLVTLLWFPTFPPVQPGGVDWVMLLVSQAPTLILGLLLQFLSFVLLLAAVTAGYASLSGWGGPRAEIVERFE